MLGNSLNNEFSKIQAKVNTILSPNLFSVLTSSEPIKELDTNTGIYILTCGKQIYFRAVSSTSTYAGRILSLCLKRTIFVTCKRAKIVNLKYSYS